MEIALAKVEQIQLGKIIAQDVFANTKNPIITKDTIVRPVHLLVLEAFNIKEVLIKSAEPLELTEESESIQTADTTNLLKSPLRNHPAITINTFERSYQFAIQQLKKEFFNWEAGAQIDITKVRSFFLPLINFILEDRTIMFDLNLYSRPEEYIYHHCIATGLISAVITQKLGYDKGTIIQMGLAGLLADCGMSKVDRRIRNKTEALTVQEYSDVKRHPMHSLNMIKLIPVLKDAMKLAIFQHHERLDGSGYPRGDKGERLSKYAQIIAVADVFHAMTSERLYRSRTSAFKVVEMIQESEFGKFDIEVVKALVSVVAELPLGTTVELSNRDKAEVMYINQYAVTRPLVKICRTEELIDLSQKRLLHITKIVKQ